jgi:hypothetical protein
MIGSLALMLVLGRLVIWTLQTSNLIKPVWKIHPLLNDLGGCDFCLGFWVYLGLDLIFKFNLLEPIYVPVVSEASTALAVSFIVHLVRVGWQTNYSVLDMTED